MSNDSHRLAEERSLAFHRAIAERMRADPRIVQRALARVEEWLSSDSVPARYASEWRKLLALPLDALVEAMTARTQAAHDLRQVSPFAGALDARTRWQIHRDTRRQLQHETR